jgi:hypothetical protein
VLELAAAEDDADGDSDPDAEHEASSPVLDGQAQGASLGAREAPRDDANEPQELSVAAVRVAVTVAKGVR